MLERDGIIADGEVNSEVRRVCVLSLKALGALGGFYNISYAAKGWNEYKAYTYTGYTYKRSDRLNLDSWIAGEMRKTPMPISRRMRMGLCLMRRIQSILRILTLTFSILSNLLLIKVDVVPADYEVE